jgi:hypothetical protein
VKKFFSNMNPTIRGFLVILAIVLVIVVLQLQTTLIAISMLLRIAFFLAIAFFIYLLWRERRQDIANWSDRARRVFYGAALLIVVDLSAFFLGGASGIGALAFVLVLVLCGFAMFRVWRDEHTYS